MSFIQFIIAAMIITFFATFCVYTILDRILKYKEKRFDFDKDISRKIDEIYKWFNSDRDDFK